MTSTNYAVFKKEKTFMSFLYIEVYLKH